MVRIASGTMMANNRISLVCELCGEGFAIAKWYPGAGWYTNRVDNDSYNEWMEKHSHGLEYPFRMEYEIPRGAL